MHIDACAKMHIVILEHRRLTWNIDVYLGFTKCFHNWIYETYGSFWTEKYYYSLEMIIKA